MRGFHAVVLLIGGCGDGLTIPDAQTVPTDDLRGLVTVHYGSPVGGVHVFFQNTDSSLVHSTRTDGNGSANGFLAPGGFVTVVEPFGAGRIWTWAGVKPGDILTLHNQFEPAEEVTINLTVPQDPDALGYLLRTPCTQVSFDPSQGRTAVPVMPCTGNVSDLLVTTYDNAQLTGIPTHFLYRSDVEIEFLADVVLPGPYQTPRMSTITATHVPTPDTSLFVTQEIGDDLVLSGGFGFLTSADSWSASLVLPVAPGMRVVTRLDEQPRFDSIASSHVVDWGGFTENYVIDFGAAALYPVVARPTFDVENRAVRWSEGREGAMPDAMLASVVYYRPEIGSNYAWTMIAPRGSETTLRFPLLPVPELNPQLGDIVTAISLYSIATTGGFDAIGSDVLGRLEDRGWPTSGPEGHVVYQRVIPPLLGPD